MNRSDLIQAVKALGIKEGDIVLLHSSLGSIGHVEGGAKTVVEVFLGVLGPSGTLLAPTFATSSEVFDPDKDPTSLGAIAEAVRRHRRAVRSRHPLASVAAIGAKAKDLIKDHEKAKTAHGEGTPYHRLAEMDGYVVLLGTDQDRSTLLHTAEALCELPYLSTQRRKYLDAQGKVRSGTYHFFPGPHRNFIGLDRRLREKGIVKLDRIGNAVVRVMKAKPLLDELVAMLKADPAGVLCDNPRCEDCIRQRAAINRWRIDREAFRLVVPSHIAGSTVNEIIDNLTHAGINEIELTAIGDKDIAALNPEEWTQIAKQLTDAEITVRSVASRFWQQAFDRVLYACRSLQARQMVLPLQSGLLSEALEAASHDLVVLMRNGVVTGKRAGELLSEYKKDVLVSFDPRGFLLAGEYPFRKSLKMPGRFRIGQVCVCDSTWGGHPTPLLQGNAEIKEVVSILRCRSYGGDMLLTWPIDHEPPDFHDYTRSFFDLLEGL
ncbi:MAG: AAC(3) family N-acetyltransferase [Planctomycetes bacterium]|nr:AAC(3) family N-acetyltransferase [Planctomycetota bacterium]